MRCSSGCCCCSFFKLVFIVVVEEEFLLLACCALSCGVLAFDSKDMFGLESWVPWLASSAQHACLGALGALLCFALLCFALLCSHSSFLLYSPSGIMDPTLYFLPLALFMRPFLRLSGIEAFSRTHQTKAADRTFFAVVRRLMSSAAAVGTAPGPFSSPHHHHPRHDATQCTSPQDDSPPRLLSAWLGLVRFLARTSPPHDSSRPPPTPTPRSMPAGSRSIASSRLASPNKPLVLQHSSRLVFYAPAHSTHEQPPAADRTDKRTCGKSTSTSNSNSQRQNPMIRVLRLSVRACVHACVRWTHSLHPKAPRTAPGMRLGVGLVGWLGSWDEWVFCFGLVGEVLGAWLDTYGAGGCLGVWMMVKERRKEEREEE
ncbi:hypothetical protein BKA81DRAFT_92841 [Phyllosticta paracitricarpa]